MSLYQINYDLRKQRNYEPLYERLKEYPMWCRPLESAWVISTSQSAVQVRDNLRAVMDDDDGLLVTRLEGEAAWVNLAPKVSEYLKEMLEKKAA